MRAASSTTSQRTHAPSRLPPAEDGSADDISRADLHCHSRASATPTLGVQGALGLPECATPPEELYELAKARGMSFVTITDHDTIDGVLEIADRADVFISEELSAWFKGEPQAAHVLCLGITPDDHDWLQAHRTDIATCAAYLHEHEITCALAHPFFSVRAQLTARHRRQLAELFPIWEVRNGARPHELNQPAALYIDTNGGCGVGGSDDHGGVDVGLTFTETPPAQTAAQFLRHLRRGRARACGEEGSAAKWVRMALALALRAGGDGAGRRPDPQTLLGLAERIMREAEQRSSAHVQNEPFIAADARGVVRAWLDAIDLRADTSQLLGQLKHGGLTSGDLFRRARTTHEQRLARAAAGAVAAARRGTGYGDAGPELFAGIVAGVPYAAASVFLGNEKARLASPRSGPPRVALVADAIGGTHGVTNTLEQIRTRGVPGFEIEVVGTDHNVDRRLPSVAEIEIPYYRGLSVGIPNLPALAETLAEGAYDAVHLCTPGPAGVASLLVARMLQLPIVGSYHTEFERYATIRTGDKRLQAAVRTLLASFYGRCDQVLSPSGAADLSLTELGVESRALRRWERGVDLGRFACRRRFDNGGGDAALTVFYAGRLTREKGVDLLAEAFLRAQALQPELHLLLAGGGPEQELLRQRLGTSATFLGWLEGADLAAAYARADIFLFASRTDTFGQVLLEAQASGLPIVAVDEGGPRDLLTNGTTALLRPPEATSLAAAVLELAESSELRRRLGEAGRAAVKERTWERALLQLRDGYTEALSGSAARRRRVA